MFFEKLFSIFGQTSSESDSRKNTLQPGLQEIYSDCYKFTDFQLVSSSGDKIPCHRIILAARCRFFFEMFKNVSENSTNEPLKVQSANTKDLQAFVDYIYTNKVTENAATIGLLTLSDMFLLDELKIKCLEVLINTVSLENDYQIIGAFEDSNFKDLLTGEMSWKFASYLNFKIENCLEIFLVGHKHDLAVLKINALYFIKDHWNEIKDSEKFTKMKQDQLDGIPLIEDYIGYNDMNNPVIIPYKVTLNRKMNPGRYGFTISERKELKFPPISDVQKNWIADVHGGIAIGNFILKVGNKSMARVPHQTVIDEVVKGSSVTFELNIAMRANMRYEDIP